MRKKANIGFVVMVALLVICSGAVVLNIAGTGRYNAKTEYQRLEDRYIAESGVDLSLGFFLNYLSEREVVLTYAELSEENLSVVDKYSPYLLDEIKASDEEDIVYLEVIENECKDYLACSGYLDFIDEDSIEFGINTFGDKESFKLSRMCTEHDFLLSFSADDGEKRSKLKPVFLKVKTKYRGGEVMADIKISNLFAVREPFSETGEEISGALARIDTNEAIIEYENYQNYRGNIK